MPGPLTRYLRTVARAGCSVRPAMRPFGRWAAGTAVAMRAAGGRARGAQAAGRCGAAPVVRHRADARRSAPRCWSKRSRLTRRSGCSAATSCPGVAGGEGTHTGTERRRARASALPHVYYTDGPVGPRAGQGHRDADRRSAWPPPSTPRWPAATARVIGDEVEVKGNDVVFAPTVEHHAHAARRAHVRVLRRGPVPDDAARRRRGSSGAAGQGVIANVKHFAANNQEGAPAPAAPGAPLGVGALGQPPHRGRARRRAHAARGLPAPLRGGGEGGQRRLGDVLVQPPQRRRTRARTAQLLERDPAARVGLQGLRPRRLRRRQDTAADALNNGLDFEPWPGRRPTRPALVERGARRRAGRPRRRSTSTSARILRTLFAYGFFDRAAYRDDDAADRQGRRTRRPRSEIEEPAIMLLENDGGVLPLDRGKAASRSR